MVNLHNNKTNLSSTMGRATKLFAILAILVFSVLALFACGEESGTRVETIDISQNTITLVVGNTEQLTYTITPSGATNADVHFVSANSSIASVSRDGVVTAVSVGQTTVSVTADDGGATDAVTVQVVAEPITLATPTNVQFDGEKIVWDRVDNNYGYEVLLNGEPYPETIISTYLADFEAGITYTVQVRALGNDRAYLSSEYSAEMTFMQYQTPSIAIDGGVINITANSNANIFQVLMNGETYRERLSAFQYIIEDTLEPGRYTFQVIALGDSAQNVYNSQPSNTVSVSKLSAPTNAMVEDRILTFDSITGAQSYTIMIVNNLNNNVSYQTVPATNDIVTFDLGEGYEPGQYNIYIKALGDSRTTLDSAYSEQVAVDKLATPTNLQISNGLLTWQAVEQATGYVMNIQFGGQTILEENIPSPTFDFASKYINSGDYYITIMATGSEIDGVNRYVNSDYSDGITVTKLATPNNISISADQIYWDNVDLTEGYSVLLDDSLALPVQTNNYISLANTAMQTFIAKSYTMRVRALGNGSNMLDSQYSSTFNFKKLSTIDTNFVTLSGSTITWTAVADTIVYYVYINGSGTPIAVSGTSIDLGASSYSEGEYSITVQAISTANNAVSGEQSEPITFTKLPAPSNFRVDNGALTYSMPDNTSFLGYNLRVGRTEYTGIMQESLTFDQYMNDDETSTISLQAVGDGSSTISSNFSEAINLHKISSAVNMVIEHGILVWDTVSGATSYQITVDLNGLNGEIYQQTMEVGASEPARLDLLTTNLFDTAGMYTLTMKVIGTTSDVSDLTLTYDINSRSSISVNTRKLQDVQNLRVQSGLVVWDAVVGVEYYEVVLDGESKGNCGTTASYRVEGASGAHTVTVYARGNQSSVLDANNNEETSTIDVTKLGNVFNFYIDKATIRWDAITNASSYDIEIRNANNEVLRSATNNTANSYAVYSIDGNQTLYVQLRANGNNSNVVSGDYGGTATSRYFEVDVLSIPANMHIEDSILYFDYVANATTYELVIEQGGTPDSQTLTAQEGQTRGEFNLATYLSGRSAGVYSIYLRASNETEGEMYLSSSYTNSLSVEKLNVPVLSLFNGTINFTTISNASEYSIGVQSVSAENPTYYTLSNSESTFVMDTAFGAGEYNIYIQALGDGTSTLSSEVSSGFEVEKLRTPVASVEGAKDLEVSMGQLVWNPVENAALYTIMVYRVDGLTGELTLSYTDSLQPSTNMSYLPTGTAGNYRISLQVIGDATRYVSSDVYEYAQTLQKLSAPDNVHIEQGLIRWSNNAEAENGYSMIINNNEFSVGSEVSYELGENYSGGVSYTIYLRTIGNSINKLSSDLSDELNAMKLSAQTLEVQDGEIVWGSSSASSYNLVVTSLEGDEIANITTENLYYALNDVPSGYYYVRIKDLGSGYSADTSGSLTNGYLNSDFSADLPVYKLASPANMHINSEFNAEDIGQLMRIGYLEWDEVQNANSYTVTVYYQTAMNLRQTVENNYFNISSANLSVGNYSIYLTSKGQNAINGADTFACINSDEVNMSAYKLGTPTNLNVQNGLCYWDAPSQVQGLYVELQYLFYYYYAPVDETINENQPNLLYTGSREFQTLFEMGNYRISVAAIGDNCIRSDIATLENDYLFNLFSDGAGTEEDPYIIKTFTENQGSIYQQTHTAVSQLEYINYMYDKHFKLDENITITNEFSSIGIKDEISFGNIDDTYMFQGTIDGNGHTITFNRGEDGNLAFGGAGSYGFIYQLGQNGVIKNLTFENFSVAGTYSTVGIVTAQNYGTIDNVSVISDTGIYSAYTASTNVESYIGGIAGRNYSSGVITNSSAQIHINATNATTFLYTGGITGYNEGTIQNCANNALYQSGIAIQNQINGTFTGGIAGYMVGDSAIIYACVNNASVYAQPHTGTSGSALARAGGIVGQIVFNGTASGTYVAPYVRASYNTGTISVLESGNDSKVGGIVGYFSGGTIDSCYNVGEVYMVSGSSHNTANVGAIVGWNISSERSRVVNSFYIDYNGMPESTQLAETDMTKVTSEQLMADSTEPDAIINQLNQTYNVFVYSTGSYPKLSWEVQ